MHKQHWITYLLLACNAPTIMAVSLDQIQPIISFTASCTSVYTSEINGCTAGDITNRGSCSPECIESLEALSRSLNTACVGTRAFSGSLIGLFFQGLGVQTLCPNAGGGGGGNVGSPTRPGPPDPPPATETRRPQPTQTQTQTGEILTPTTSPTRRPTASTNSTNDATNTRSTSTTSDSYVTPSPPPSTTASDPAPTRTTLEPSTTTTARDPENDPFGGFGNAFDIIAPNRAASTSQSRKMAIGLAGAAVLFTIQFAWQ